MKTRVVITGMGAVTPIGIDVATYGKALKEGRSGVTKLDLFDTSTYPSQIAAQVEEEVIPDGMSNKDVRRLDRFSLFALEAADQAWRQAGIDISKENPWRCGATVGAGIGGINTIAIDVVKLDKGGPRKVSPLMIPKGLINMASGNIAIRLGLNGPNKSIVTACAAGTHCIGEAASQIQLGKVDVMVCGGAEATVVPFGLAGFGAMKALSRRNDDPEGASRPFDAGRDGFVIGEGAGILVIESEEHALARGAEIIGEIAGFGESCDAYHITSPHPEGAGGAMAIKNALDDAQLLPSDIQYYNAHGTSTKYNDATETLALKHVFGDDMPPVSSTKSMTGHLLGAAGAIEAVACLIAMDEGFIPPNINYETPDPECDVNIVANEAREAELNVVMSNSLGFGGHNASVILKRYA